MKTLTKVLGTCVLMTSFMWAGNVPKEYPAGELGRMVKLGEAIMMDTSNHPLTKDLVGNKLSCISCHLRGDDGKPGTTDAIGSFMGTATAFPAYSAREKTVQTLQDRINNCFMRSMNGKRPIVDTEASIAMATYVTWLSQGMPMHMDPKRPVNPAHSKAWADNQKKFAAIQKKATHQNYLNGEKIFAEKCAYCHGQKGEGMGEFPPLWGKNGKGEWLSYNTGAGMSKLNKAAPWIKENMPFGQGNTLSDQEAADVALYVDAQERAPFDLTKGLLPKDEMGHYNSKVLEEKHSVRTNFSAFGLDVDIIRGDKKIQ